MIDENLREAHEATDYALVRLDGLISALDVIEGEIRFPDEGAPAAKAFRSLRPLMAEKMAQIWQLRQSEWQSIGGK